MEQKNSSTLVNQIESDFVLFCKLNNVDNVEEFRFECFKKGYYIEKYGLLGEDNEIKPYEILVEKEVVVNADCKECNEKLEMIGVTLQNLRSEITEKNSKISEQENKIKELSSIITSRLARFHSTSNLKD